MAAPKPSRIAAAVYKQAVVLCCWCLFNHGWSGGVCGKTVIHQVALVTVTECLQSLKIFECAKQSLHCFFFTSGLTVDI